MASSSCSGTSISNVDRFVLSVTPDVPFQTLDLQVFFIYFFNQIFALKGTFYPVTIVLG